MPNSRAAASAVSRCAVQIAATSTPGKVRQAAPWTFRLQFALMIPTLVFFPFMSTPLLIERYRPISIRHSPPTYK
ncbi:hypothetical protein D9M68_926620 [compost metagenome]